MQTKENNKKGENQFSTRISRIFLLFFLILLNGSPHREIFYWQEAEAVLGTPLIFFKKESKSLFLVGVVKIRMYGKLPVCYSMTIVFPVGTKGGIVSFIVSSFNAHA